MTDLVNDTGDMDLIWGIEAISQAIGRNPRQTYHMLRMGALPAKNVQGRWVASKAKLIAALTEDAA